MINLTRMTTKPIEPMRPFAIRELERQFLIPIGDPGDWILQSVMLSTAFFLRNGVEYRVSVADARRCGLWKPEYDLLPKWGERPEEDHEDESAIVKNEDRTK